MDAKTKKPTLAEILEECGLSEADLAKEIGSSQPTVSRWVTGTNPPTLKYAVLIAKATGRPIQEIIESLGIDCTGVPENKIPDPETRWQIKKKAILDLLRAVIRQIERL